MFESSRAYREPGRPHPLDYYLTVDDAESLQEQFKAKRAKLEQV